MCVCMPQQLVAAVARLELFKEVVALVVYEDKCREVLNGNLPNSLHTELGILNTLNALDATLRKYSSYATNSAEVEATMLLASVCYHLSAITLSNHYQ